MTIGITGGIGSGKSYVAAWLAQHYHIPFYNCDLEARRLMLTPSVRRRITALVGDEAYLPDGQLNKPLLAAYVFSDEAHTAAINAIVHPEVKRDVRDWSARQNGLALVESAILIEAGFCDAVDRLIVVEAPLDVRIRRACQRDGVSEEQVRARIAHQMTDEARRPYADLVVVNDGSDFRTQLSFFIDSLLGQSAYND
ncbi:MAG: dephospho-CoA kinase [Bacteroidales bacterium]|nr:dephospho-CoA kinase [Bacteroidales bacterium]